MITKRRHIFAALGTVLLLGATTMPAVAKPGKWKVHPNQNRAYNVQQTYTVLTNAYPLFAQNSISPAQAKAIARKHVKGGEAVDVTRKGETYRVRVIVKGGKVVDVFIDAKSGRVKK